MMLLFGAYLGYGSVDNPLKTFPVEPFHPSKLLFSKPILLHAVLFGAKSIEIVKLKPLGVGQLSIII